MISVLVVGAIVAFFVIKKRLKRSSTDIEKHDDQPFAPLAPPQEVHGTSFHNFLVLSVKMSIIHFHDLCDCYLTVEHIIQPYYHQPHSCILLKKVQNRPTA